MQLDGSGYDDNNMITNANYHPLVLCLKICQA